MMPLAHYVFGTIRKAHGLLIASCTMLSLLSAASALDRAAIVFGAADADSLQSSQLRAQIDIRQLRWPAPPAPARITMLAEFFGEKPAPPPVRKKRSWMQRVSGIPEERPPAKNVRRLAQPYGVAADSKGRIYAADSAVGRILIFDQDGSNVSEYASTADLRFKKIIGLAIDDKDRLFVTDADLRCVDVIGADGEALRSFGSEYLARPAGAAVDDENRLLYVADPGRDRVAVFDADTFSFLRLLGTTSRKHNANDPGDFNKPSNVAVDREGNVYVSDSFNSRVQVFDADGEFVRTIGSAGIAPGRLLRPKGIAIDHDGHVWVADAALNRVQVFDPQGRLLAHFGQLGNLPGQFAVPAGLFIDQRNRVIISDQGRVQIFRYITDSELAATSVSNPAEAAASAQAR